MAKSNTTTTILVIIAIAIISILLFTGENKRTTTDKLKVAATIFPLYDITKNIVGNKADVIQILPSGSSPHTYELTPEKVKKLEGTKIVFKIGHGVDDWANDVADSISGVAIVTVDNNVTLKKFSEHYSYDHEHEEEYEHEESEERVHEHGTYNPHYWLSVENAKIIAYNIYNTIADLNPDNEEYYRNKMEGYLSTLNQLKLNAQDKLSNLSSNKLVTTHDAWQYFNDEFGLETVGTFQPSPGKEPTPQQLIELQNLVVKYKVKALFSEPQLSKDTIKPFADDADLKIYVLDPLGGIDNRQSYLELIKYNVDTIYNALK